MYKCFLRYLASNFGNSGISTLILQIIALDFQIQISFLSYVYCMLTFDPFTT